jgi:hypothetical protein
VRVSGTIHPRNINLGARALFTAIQSTGVDDTGTGTGTGTAPDTSEVPADTTATELPPEEPPIRIPTERVLSLVVEDLHEKDSWEGSVVTEDHQHDWDIILGTQSSGNNNLAVWFEGYPDKYSGERLYNSVPNYAGYSSEDINQIATGNLDQSSDKYRDAVAATAISDVSGGFEVWLNQAIDGQEGRLGIGATSTFPTGYYSNGGGAGLAIVLADFDQDGDLDVALGTREGANSGNIEFWENDSYGYFTFVKSLTASGEVNALVTADFNDDGWPDVAAGTKTTNSNQNGKLEVWLNKIQTQQAEDFHRVGTWDTGQVKALAAGSMNADYSIDLVAGLQTGSRRGEVELWLNEGNGSMFLADKVPADDVVLSIALGQLDLYNSSLDIAAGTAARSVQAWFCYPEAAVVGDIIPIAESWADANAGGLVNAIAIRKVQASRDNPESDLLNDIVVGTAVSQTTGEIVVYLNPYVWTVTQTTAN